MVSSDDNAAARIPCNWFLHPRSLFSRDHKIIGMLFLTVAMVSVLLAIVLSLVVRLHAAWPFSDLPILSGFFGGTGRYGSPALLHGSLMVFWVLTAAPQLGFGHYFLPLQIGAPEMAFPSLSRLSFWVCFVSLGGMIASFFAAANTGLTLWIASAGVFCLGGLLAALNFSVTAIDLRAKGMTLPRLPMTAWAWLVTALLSLLVFSMLLAACVFLLAGRLLGAQPFAAIPAPGAAPGAESWRHVFWFFAQGSVYVAMLPCFGIVSHLVATFARRPVWAPRWAVLALCGVGVFGFCVWGFHMFATGMNPGLPLVFSSMAGSLAVPSLLLVASWFGTLWGARVRMTVPMLFACGSVSFFLSGGLSGFFLARGDLAGSAASGQLVAGHFHLVMGVAAAFAILAALFFWFPKMLARPLDPVLGRIHFWTTYAGAYCIFMPMHWLGLVERSRGGFDGRTAPGAAAFISFAIVITTAAQILFFFNVAQALVRRSRNKLNASANPWGATTLEWTVPSPPPLRNFTTAAVVYRGAYDFSETHALDFKMQNLPATPTAPPALLPKAAPRNS
jgi:cytochrome c oxidase subunit 1